MARLPNPGSDNGTWGDILNSFLSQAHDADGTLKSNTVGSGQIQSGAVTNSKIATGTISEAKLDSAVQTKLNSSGGAILSTDITDSTSTGRSVLTAASAAAARTAIGAGTVDTAVDIGLGNVDNTSDATKNSAVATLTNKTIDANNNTISNLAHGAEVDNPSSGVHGVTGSVVGTTDTQTLSAKTLTSPRINQVLDSNGATALTFTATASAVNYLDITNNSATFTPRISAMGTDSNIGINMLPKGVTGWVTINGVEVVSTSRTQTLSNKTLTTPVITSISNSGTITIPTGTDTLVARATTDTLTNKTIDGGSNTLSNISTGSITGFDTQVQTSRLDQMAAPTASVSMNSNLLTDVTDPSSAQDAATKNYVDNLAQGLKVKQSARAATTGTETYTIVGGTVTQIDGTTIDGVSVNVGARIVVKDAPATSGSGSVYSTQPANGIYVVDDNTINLTLSRVADMSGSVDPAGSFVLVQAGTTNGSNGFVASVPSAAGSFTYGTDDIAWSQFSGAGQITANNGLSKAGNTISIENSGVLTVSHGGTGASSLTGIVVGNGTSPMTTVSAPTGAIVGDTDAQTLTNKTLTTPIITSISNSGTITVPAGTDTLVGRATTDTLTNKTIDGDNNTISNLDIGLEVDWAAAGDVADRTAFAPGDKLLIFEVGVGLRKIDYDDLPTGMLASTYDPGGVSEQLVGLTATQTLTNKTLTSPVINTPTGIAKGDVGLGNVDNTSDSTKNSAAATLTNKRITPRVGSTASSATPSIDTDSVDAYSITALATNITSMTTNLTGTPNNFQKLIIRILDNGSARTITWGASFEDGSVALPTTTTAGKTLMVGLIYDSVDGKWACEASGSRA